MKNRHFLFQFYPSFAYYSVNFVQITTGKNKEDITFFYSKSVKHKLFEKERPNHQGRHQLISEGPVLPDPHFQVSLFVQWNTVKQWGKAFE